MIGDNSQELSDDLTEKTLSDKSSESDSSKVQITSRSLFVPYWNVENLQNLNRYDRLIYFGVSANESGVNRDDQGFANIRNFSNQTKNITTLVTLRMLDSDTNLAILENPQAQKKLAVEVADIAEEYDFAGVVLDLELSVIPFSNVKNQISSFIEVLDSEFESRSLYFAVALYGDTYFRARPYDVKKIGESADEILIMAYDFHKSRGEPGPNYPFSGKEKYGYDFKTMVSDFSADVPPENINVIFGMYGYNWTLGKQGKPLKAATAFSLNDAEEMFYPSCSYQSCNVSRDNDSAEMKVIYIDSEGYKNESWFEDEQSVEIKSEYLQEQGIGRISYWVNGYF
jgi:spore germination protein YaaH